MTQELKPCPFCGKVPDEMHRASTKCSSTMPHAGQYHGEVWHFCGNGMLASASVYRASKADALRAAIEAWNTRAQIPGEVCEIEGTGEGVQLPVVEERTCEKEELPVSKVVRCNECRFLDWNTDSVTISDIVVEKREAMCHRCGHKMAVAPGGFCAWGERRWDA